MTDAKRSSPPLMSPVLAILLVLFSGGVAAQEPGSLADTTSLTARSLATAGLAGAALGSLLVAGSIEYIGGGTEGPGALLLGAAGGAIGASIGVAVAGSGEVPAPNALTAGVLGLVGGLVGGGIGIALTADSAVPAWIGFSIGQGTLTGALGYAFRRR
jgi:hypothetical protein